jgi:hypothetical protein
MYGLTDVLVPRQHGEWLARNVPDAEAIIDEEAGHLADSARVTERYRWGSSIRPEPRDSRLGQCSGMTPDRRGSADLLG